MSRTAWALLALMSLLGFIPAAERESPPQEETGIRQVVVGEEGLELYPRFNKSLKPLAVLDQGQVLSILRELRTWKQVRVADSDLEGWIYVEVKEAGQGFEKKVDLVAAPSVAGLVARGWSKRYAGARGADISKVDEIKKRLLDGKKFARFLEEMEK